MSGLSCVCGHDRSRHAYPGAAGTPCAASPCRCNQFTPQVLTEAPDKVTTGFVRIPVTQLRSFEDRLGKAARKNDNGDVAAAWIAVGRVQAELRSLLLSEMPSATAADHFDHVHVADKGEDEVLKGPE